MNIIDHALRIANAVIGIVVCVLVIRDGDDRKRLASIESRLAGAPSHTDPSGVHVDTEALAQRIASLSSNLSFVVANASTDASNGLHAARRIFALESRLMNTEEAAQAQIKFNDAVLRELVASALYRRSVTNSHPFLTHPVRVVTNADGSRHYVITNLARIGAATNVLSGAPRSEAPAP